VWWVVAGLVRAARQEREYEPRRQRLGVLGISAVLGIFSAWRIPLRSSATGRLPKSGPARSAAR
jgi:hypothetical protein